MARGAPDLPDLATADPGGVTAWLRTLAEELPEQEQANRLREAAEQCDRAPDRYASAAAALLRYVAEDTHGRASRVNVETWARITDDVTMSYEMVRGSVAVSFASPSGRGPTTQVQLCDADVALGRVLTLLHRARADYRQACAESTR